MAKVQDLPPNPLKISGACGRLLCCLKYEHPLYAEFAREVPAVGSPVEVDGEAGVVVAHQVPADAVLVRMKDSGAVSQCSRGQRVRLAAGVRGAPGTGPGDPRASTTGRPVRVRTTRPRPAALLVVLALLLAALVAGCSATPGSAPAVTPSPAATRLRARAVAVRGRRRPPPTVDRCSPCPAGVVPGTADPPAGSGAARYTAQPVAWSRCAKRVECARVAAPLDWSAPDGRALTLVAGRVRATATPRLGSLFLNPGGPGGSGLDLLGGLPDRRASSTGTWSAGTRAASVVPRPSAAPTTRRSTGCSRWTARPTTPPRRRSATPRSRGFGRDCLARSGALLEHISTADTVRDLDLLRGLVGDERLHYLGFSYGTQIGAQYADTFPEHTGPMVLDGAVDLRADSRVDQIQGFERALGHFAAWCAEQRCSLGADRPAVLASVRKLLADLDAHPLPAAPGRPLTQQLGVSGVLTPLYDGTDGWPRLADALADAQRGQGAALLALADAGNERGRDGRYGSLASAFPAIRCRDSQAESVAAADRRAASLVPKAPVLGAVQRGRRVLPALAGAARAEDRAPAPRRRPAGGRRRHDRRPGHAVRVRGRHGPRPRLRGARHPRGRGAHGVRVERLRPAAGAGLPERRARARVAASAARRADPRRARRGSGPQRVERVVHAEERALDHDPGARAGALGPVGARAPQPGAAGDVEGVGHGVRARTRRRMRRSRRRTSGAYGLPARRIRRRRRRSAATTTPTSTAAQPTCWRPNARQNACRGWRGGGRRRC